MSKGKELAKNTVIIAVGRLTTQFSSFLLIPIYTLILSPESYGFLDLVLIYIGLLGPSLTLQVEMAAFRLLLDTRGASDETAQSRIITSAYSILITGVILGVALIAIASTLFNINYGLSIALLLASQSLLNLNLQISRGVGNNKQYALTSIITGISMIFFNVLLLVVLDLEVVGVLLANSTANIIGVIYLTSTLQLHKHLKVSYASLSSVKSLISYSWPLIPNHLSLWGINGINRTIISLLLELHALGVYAVASKVSQLYTSIYSIYAMSWTESVSTHIKSKDEFISHTTNATARLFGALALLLLPVISIILPAILTPEYSLAREIIPLLIIGSFFSSLVAHYGAIYIAVKKTKEVAKVTLQALLISSIITLATIQHIGIVAPALSMALTYIYISYVRHRDIQKYTTVKYTSSTILYLLSMTVSMNYLYYLNSTTANILSLVVGLLFFTIINRGTLSKIYSASIKRLNNKPGV